MQVEGVVEMREFHARRKDIIFTTHENQIAHLVSEGLTNKAIAASMHRAEQTIKNMLHRIMVKAGVRNRAELTSLFVLNGFLRCVSEERLVEEDSRWNGENPVGGVKNPAFRLLARS